MMEGAVFQLGKEGREFLATPLLGEKPEARL